MIAPHGSKLWRLAYRFGGKQKTLAIGAYPTITLKAARDKREDAKRLLANGTDPSTQRRLDKQIASTGNTFKAVAEEVLAKQQKEGRADVTLTKPTGHVYLFGGYMEYEGQRRLDAFPA